MIPVTLNPVRLAVTAAFILLVAYAGIQTVRVADLKKDLAEEIADRSKADAALFKVAADARGKIAKIQSDHAAQQQGNADGYAKDRARNESKLAAAKSESERLSRLLSAYASGSDLGADTDAHACRGIRDRASTLGNLLEQADGLATSLAGAAEKHADEVRLLKGQIKADREACRPL